MAFFAANGGDLQNTWWMGATDMHHEGGWLWMSGAPWSWENWNDGEPNQNGNEDCGAFDSQGGYKVIKVVKISPEATRNI